MNRTGSFTLIVAVACLHVLLGAYGLVGTAQAAYLRNQPVTVAQPDGEILQLFASGDEHYNWLHDKNGYVVIQGEQGVYAYASTKDGLVVPTVWRVNSVSPDAVGLAPNVKPDPDLLRAKIQRSKDLLGQSQAAVPSPTSGALNNLVIFIRFSDESEFSNALSSYDDIFNKSSSGAVSLKAYYKEVSYDALTISSSFYSSSGTTVVSYQDSHPRAYYQPYNASTNPNGYQSSDVTSREHTLLTNAINAVKASISSSLDLDLDNDGMVDSVSFIIKGSVDGWSDLLWPHMWSLYTQNVTINSKRVYNYLFLLDDSISSSAVGVVCHEMFHVLGAPDLYHYTSNGVDPVGAWDIMENVGNPPQHMGAFMKMRYGKWISSIPTITASGTYSLSPLTSSTGNSYKIASPNSSTEYFVIEYRRKTGVFESSVPGSGLLVYRINTSQDGQGNASGPPDEVYVYRPDGTTSANGSPSLAYFSSAASRTAISDSTNPSSFLASGGAGGLNISNIGDAGDAISFTVTIGAATVNSIDILWRNTKTGKNVVWFMNGASRVSYSQTLEAGVNWKGSAVADFDADGKADILWRHVNDGRNVIWYMDGVSKREHVFLQTVVQPWKIVGAADFNNDGSIDILWRNPANGKNILWLMNGTTLSQAVTLTTAPTAWNVEGVGDLDADGKVDILWRNHNNKRFVGWLMDGSSLKQSQNMTDVANPWRIRGVGDFDGDGKADILWRNLTNGKNAIWFMNGLTYGQAQMLDVVNPENGWDIIGVGKFN
jgi:M6 family metalloprotease-like protein